MEKQTQKPKTKKAVGVQQQVIGQKYVNGWGIFIKSEAFPKGYLHHIYHTYGESGGNTKSKQAYNLCREYIEQNKDRMWYITGWKIKKMKIFLSL